MLIVFSDKYYIHSLVNLQSEEERQAQLRERARRLLAEARRGSTPPTEVIRICPESVKAYVEAEDKLQRINDELNHLERQNSIGELVHSY